MNQNKRIVLNTAATYTRSMFGVLCGIFSARWVLEALGQVDFGLYAVVGGMAIFLSFLNIQFAGAISRYYAYSIGQAKVSNDVGLGLQECRAWFTTAVMIHTVASVLLVVVGWPLGICALRNGWVSVPVERLNACLWVWRTVCVSSFFSMVSVPFQAMYTAKQYIAELTIYSFAQTILRTGFIYYMVVTPKDWLVPYAVAMAAVVVVPQLAICIRAYCVFPECRIIPRVFSELNRVRQVANYAAWTAIGGMGYVASHQCMGILLNNYFGARVAGSFGVSQTVSGEAASLTGALQGAFQPAITTAHGAGDDDSMRTMAFRVCKVGSLLTLMFAIPMALEIDEILLLWLKNPPPYAASMCIAALAFIVIEKLSGGHQTAVNASGRIARFQAIRGVLRSSVIPLALLAMALGWGAVIAVFALPVSAMIVVLGDVWLARTRVGMSAKYWLRHVLVPLVCLSVISMSVGAVPRMFLGQSIYRVLVTAVSCLISMFLLSWILLLSREEKVFILNRLHKRRVQQ